MFMPARAAAETPVRRIGEQVEIHSGTARPGRTPYVLGRDDLLLLVEHAAARLHCRRRVHSLPPDLVSIVDVGDVVVLELDGAAPSRALYLRPGILAKLTPLLPAAGEAPSASWRVVHVMAGAGVCQLADRITAEDDLPSLISEVAAARERQLRVAAAEGVGHAVVWRVRDQLRDGFSRKDTLAQISVDVGMCRSALVRAFTRELGIPPHAYRTHVRVMRARDLIAAGRPLSDVSIEVGFADQSHMSRHFKRLLGFTPSSYAGLSATHVQARAEPIVHVEGEPGG
jgi:AraC-like DNA-binding protein